MNKNILTMLLEGKFICPVTCNFEYEELQDQTIQQKINEWLEPIGMYLARVGEAGAFYMAPAILSEKDVSRVRNEFVRFRDVFGTIIRMLDLIRRTDPQRYSLSVGEFVALHDLEKAVSEDSTLQENFTAMLPAIYGASARFGKDQRERNRDNLRKLLEHLEKEGYMVLANKDTGTFRFTGKIDYLYEVLDFLKYNQVIPALQVQDTNPEEQSDLLDTSLATENYVVLEGSL